MAWIDEDSIVLISLIESPWRIWERIRGSLKKLSVSQLKAGVKMDVKQNFGQK